MAGGCFCSTRGPLGGLLGGEAQLVAVLEGPRWLNSHFWHLSTGSWKAAGPSWALSVLSWGFLTKLLSKVFVLPTKVI